MDHHTNPNHRPAETSQHRAADRGLRESSAYRRCAVESMFSAGVSVGIGAAAEYASFMGQRLPRALLIGLLTFVIAYVVQMTVAIVWSTYANGPLPDPILGMILPLFLSFLAGAIAFRQYSE